MPSIGNLHIYTENPWLIVGTESNVLKSRPAGYVIGFATDTRKFFVFDIHEGWMSPRTAVAKHKILSDEHEDTKIVDPLEEGQLLVVQKDQDNQNKLKWTALSRGTNNQILTSTNTSVEWRDPQILKHQLLNEDTHDDTNTTTVLRGMLITGQDFGGDTKWSGLSLGASGTFLKSDGTDAIWSMIDWDDIANKPSAFSVTVRHNSGVDVGTRPRLNFIEGTNITLTVADDNADNEVDITISATDSGVSTHNLLQSDVHTDTNTTTVDRGMLIVGQDVSGTTLWSGLTLGSSGQVLKSDGTDAVWSNVSWSEVSSKPSSFPVTVRKNSGSNIGTRPRLNFIEGTNITMVISDDDSDNEIDITINATGGGGSSTHNLLQSDVHTDTNTATVSRGAVIVGRDVSSTILWDTLVPTSPNTYLKYTGLDTVWDYIYWDDIYDKPSEFPVSVYENSSFIASRPGINFIAGTGINITAYDTSSIVDVLIESTATAGAHQLLSTTHDDTNPTTVSRGMIITGQDVSGTTQWSGLPLGSSGQVLKSDGTDVIWDTVDWTEVSNKPSRFPITVRKNSGTDIGTKPRLNFIEGSNITLNITDDSIDDEIDITISSSGGVSNHNLLQSDVHTDTNTTTVARGMVITGQLISGVPRWSGLALGSSGTVLKSNGTDAVWGNVAWGEITGKPTEFPVSTYRNGTLVGTRPRLNFIEGTGISISASDDSANNRVNLTVTASHPLLSSAHTDTNPTSVQRGMLITGQNIGGINRWSGLALGSSGQVVKSNGTDVIWGAVDWSEIASKPSSFPLAVRRNSGANIGTRPRLNFIEGSNITLTVSDDATDNEIDITIAASSGVSTHNLLQSSVHTDTNTASVSRGATIVGKNFSGVNKWDALVPTTANTFLKYNGTDAVWDSVLWGDISGKPTEFPVSVYRIGVLVGTRPRLNFIEGSGITINAVDNATNNRVDITISSDAHNLLSSSHADTNPTTVARGMIITGQNIGGINKWSGLSIGTSGQVVKSNGTDVVWGSVDWSEITGKPSRFPIRVQENGITASTHDTLNFRDGSQAGTSVDFTINDDTTLNRTIIDAQLVGDMGTPTNADRWKIYGTNRGNPPSKGWYTRPWRHIGTKRDTTDTNEYNPNDVALSAAFNVTATGTPPSSVGQILDAGGTNPIFQCVLDVPGLWLVRLFFQHLGRISTTSAGSGNRMECLLQMMKKEGTTESTVPESPAIIRVNWVQFFDTGNMPTVSYGQSMVLLPIRVTYTGTSTDIRGNSVTGTVVFFKVSSNIVGSASRLLDQYLSTTSLNAYLVNPDS